MNNSIIYHEIFDLPYFLNTHGVLVLYALVLGYLWFVEKSKEEAVHVLLSAFVTSVLCLVLKELFDVPRPYIAEGLHALAGYSVRTSSLPSLHAALAFALAVTVSLHQRRFGVLLLVVAALISIGRVVAQVHYPFDIAIGALIGTAVSFTLDNTKVLPFRHKKRSN